MSEPGGAEELRELLRTHGEEAIASEAENAGLRPMRRRFRCPRPPCAHKDKRGRDAGWFAGEGGVFRWKCHSCDEGGTLIDLLVATRGWSVAEAIAHLRGQASPPARPNLRVVPAAPAADDKLPPAEVKRLWDALARDDEHGQTYLDSRGLDGGHLVRFATEKHPDPRIKKLAKGQRRVAMLLSDVVGNPRSIQFRLVREPLAKEPKQLSLTGAKTSGAFFGRPELVEASPVVCVTEGMADTLAVADWCEARAPVVGAPGKGGLARLADELLALGIKVEGKLFALFVQNDRPQNESRREFGRLSQLLTKAGARAVLVATPDEWKDVAAWRQAHPETSWPPAELARALGDDVEHETKATELVTPEGSAVAVPKLFTSDTYSQDLTTLLALLDDSMHREAIMGRGELQLSKMTDTPCLDGRELTPSDITAVRYGLEQQGRNTSAGKRLKFERKQVTEALHLIASRRRFHPLTDWVKSLKWDGRRRLDVELPHAMGQELESLEARLVRKWFLAAAARALVPGCKADNVLVLVGPQGCGKSRFCRVIGGQWFTDSPVLADDDDSKRKMRGAWIIEWAELDSMRRARDQESIKAFLTETFDEYRPLYVEQLVRADRHSLFIGTTNSEEFLSDPTGNRRFWPVSVEAIDVEWVEKHRELLIAEAAAAVIGGEQWWLKAGDELLLTEHNKRHQSEDAWTPIIREWWERYPAWSETTLEQVLTNVIEKKKEFWSRGELMRVGRALTELGWRQGPRKYVAGVKGRPRVWYPPDEVGSK